VFKVFDHFKKKKKKKKKKKITTKSFKDGKIIPFKKKVAKYLALSGPGGNGL